MKVGNPFFFFLEGGGLNACKLFEFDAKVEISKKRKKENLKGNEKHVF